MNINYKQVHSECGWHRDAIQKSKICGCFHCLEFFPPSEITEWLDESEDCPRGAGKTAVCPKCGIDSVLPESPLYKLTEDLLKAMNKEYFE